MLRLQRVAHSIARKTSRSKAHSSPLYRSYRTVAPATAATTSSLLLTPPVSSSERNMRFSRADQVAPLFFLTTVVALSFRPFSTTQADNRQVIPPHPGQTTTKDPDSSCPAYGCPLKPHDVHYNVDTVKDALETIRSLKREDASRESVHALDQSASADASAVTLTLIGYKGGQLQEQINQDRAIVVSPFFIADDAAANNNDNTDSVHQGRILLGVFDGHAPLGERVSDFAATELPKLLASKLSASLKDCTDIEQEMDITTRILSETFVELDREAPADPSGGCTATVVLQQGRKVYIANAGDSRSFIVTYRPSTGTSEIVYMTREDKPSLPDERVRVEKAGGQVYIPVRGTSRVVYNDPNTGAPTGLAMSRSIGDWAAGKMGVIPNPIVHVLDIDTLVSTELYGLNSAKSYDVDAEGGTKESDPAKDDDVYVFAVSATDGLMDYLHEDEIAKILAHAMFEENGAHPISACEHLIFAAAQAWQQAKQGRYRDDIAIAVCTLRRPPPKEVPAQ